MSSQTSATNPSDSRPPSASKPSFAGTSTRNRLLLYAVVLGVTFLSGFLPQYVKSNRLDREVQRLSLQNQIATTRDLAGLMFLAVVNNNFGVASRHASAFFDQVRKMIDEAKLRNEVEALRQIAARRDSVTAGLAKADPAVRVEVQQVVAQMHRIGVTAND